MTAVADTPVTLPTGALVATASIVSLAIGTGWGCGAWLLGDGRDGLIRGLLAGGTVMVCAVVAVLAIRPWRPRPLHRWPLVWMAGSMLRMAATLGLTFLLYSATPYGSVGLWLAVVVAYLAALVGETRLYALHMKQFAPSPGGATPSE